MLRAALATPEQPCREAWDELADSGWSALRQPLVRRAGLMPQLIHASDLAGIELDQAIRSILRTARVHEELRLELVARACQDALEEEGDAVVLRGVALSRTAYANPALRHCHDLDLLVPRGGDVVTHPTGLPISPHDSLFAPGVAVVSWADLEAVSIRAEIAGVQALVLAPPEQLVHVCVHAATQGWPHSPLWCLDAALLVRNTPALSWEGVVERAMAWNVATHVYAPLRWLRDQLGVVVPAEPLRKLAKQRRRRGRTLLRLRALGQSGA